MLPDMPGPGDSAAFNVSIKVKRQGSRLDNGYMNGKNSEGNNGGRAVPFVFCR
jgi:hypothetical protein